MSMRLPERSILPIVAIGPSGYAQSVLGTGFLVGATPTIATAAHIFDDLEEGEDLRAAAVWPTRDGTATLIPLEQPRQIDGRDIALIDIPRQEAMQSLPIVRGPAHTNLQVLCVEYSHSFPTRMPDGTRILTTTPYCHMGNVVRCAPEVGLDGRPMYAIETSFPALQGASGAPVVRMPDFAVVGMLLANRERHLLPAQVVRVVDGEDTIEEVKYFLPFGYGYSSIMLCEAFDAAGLRYASAPRDPRA